MTAHIIKLDSRRPKNNMEQTYILIAISVNYGEVYD